MFGGGSKKNDPVQTLSGSASSHCSGEVVVINVDALMDAGWNLRGDAYNALLWGAMTARVTCETKPLEINRRTHFLLRK